MTYSDPTDSPEAETCFANILEKRLNRRSLIKNGAVVGTSFLLGACAEPPSSISGKTAQPAASSSLTFTELAHGLDEYFAVAPGYDHQVLIRWGDPLFPTAEFDPAAQTEDRQLRSFGYNCDFVGFTPLPEGSRTSDTGLLTVNHEFTNPELMFPGAPEGTGLDAEQTKVDIAAHGLSVVEIQKRDGKWEANRQSGFNRRITPNTPMRFSGPAAGHPRLRTNQSPDGVATFGTYGNCAGGVTPWGTVLTAEENVDAYFSGDPAKCDEAENYQRFGMFGNKKSWHKYFERWDLAKSPREPLHVGWIVEIDPYDPASTPVKKTALGRCKHEACNVSINTDGRAVAYTGDDQKFEYIYKFVSREKFDPQNRKANFQLLDDGTLYAAKFHGDGTLRWLPLVYGNAPLNEANGFSSQADVVLDVRKAADLLGATKMDRPEDIEMNPVNGHVYAMLTNNDRREADGIDSANPRGKNRDGHIIDFWPENNDHASEVFRWDIFLLAGDPEKTDVMYHENISPNGWLSCPDNCAFDNHGNLWIATDGAETRGIADGVWATEVSGPNKALTKRFIRTPRNAELCGPFFTADNKNFFCAVQHPADGSDFNNPSTRWPDFKDDVPPRPSVVVVTKKDGGVIGS